MFATAVRFLAKKARGKSRKGKNSTGMDIGLEGQRWSATLRQILKERGPLTVASFWEQAQETGLQSKRHMKIILKWMRGQNHVKLICNHIGDKHKPTGKEFMYAYVVPKSERLSPGGDVTTSANGNDSPPSGDTAASSPSNSSDVISTI